VTSIQNGIADALEGTNTIERDAGSAQGLVHERANLGVCRVIDPCLESSEGIARDQQITADPEVAPCIATRTHRTDRLCANRRPGWVDKGIFTACLAKIGGVCPRWSRQLGNLAAACRDVRLDDGIGDPLGADGTAGDGVQRPVRLSEKARPLVERERSLHGDEGFEHSAAAAAIVGETDPADGSMPDADPVPSEEMGQASCLRQPPQQGPHRAIDNAPFVARHERSWMRKRERDVDGPWPYAHFGSSRSSPHEWKGHVRHPRATLKRTEHQRFGGRDRDPQFGCKRRSERPIERRLGVIGDHMRRLLARPDNAETCVHRRAIERCPMSVHREEGRFVVRIELSAACGDGYEGDDDGYAWLEQWRLRVQPRLLRAVFEQLRAEEGFDAIAVSRGKSPDDELEIAVRFDPDRRRRA
jgi:hypothetical protein